MKAVTFLVAALALLTSGIGTAGTLNDPAFSLTYPAKWRMKKVQSCYQLTSPHRSLLEEYTLSVCRFSGPLEKIAKDDLFFVQESSGQWMRTAGPSSPSSVDDLKSPYWRGLYAIQVCGVSDPESGFHGAGGDCVMSVVSNGKTSLMFDTVGLTREFGMIKKIIRSVRFKARH